MDIFTGQSVFQAVAIGKLRFCLQPPNLLSAFSALTPSAELNRFRCAQRSCILHLAELYDHAMKLVGEHNASIFAIYAMLVEDNDYQGAVSSYILTQNVTAEYAVFLAGESFAAAFSEMDDDYMRARAADMRNVSNHLINELVGYHEPDPLGEEPTILVDNEFSPSRTLMLDRGRLIGLVARRGSINSHAAELACALHIPSIVRTDIPPELDGHLAILDGFENRLYVDPTPEIFMQVEERAAARHYTTK